MTGIPEQGLVSYQFLVPGYITVSVLAASENEARETLIEEGGTIDLHEPIAVQGGALSIGGMHMTPLIAKIDKIGDEPVGGSLPDADFNVSDIARVVARKLENDWVSTPGAGGVTGSLSSENAGFEYTLEMVDGVLRLFHQDACCACAQFDVNDPIGEIAEQVTDAVLRDIRNG
ncbi:hypothetical protein ACIQRC_34435 [Streptomyces californicus]|uniref:hypothetical protein n=1 Tax=Streptomyces californicus TaxID=67351 RepID=UPI00382A313D